MADTVEEDPFALEHLETEEVPKRGLLETARQDALDEIVNNMITLSHGASVQEQGLAFEEETLAVPLFRDDHAR